MDIDVIRNLLDKYIAETLTDAERRQLSQLLGTPDGKAVLEQIMDREFAQEIYLNQEDESRFQQIYANLLAARKGDPVKADGSQRIPAVQSNRRRRLSWRLPAAAAILMCLGVSLYYYFVSEPVIQVLPNVASATPENDAAPGRYAAKLTLSDGTEIALDSTASGPIDIADNAVVLKEGDQLQYSNESSNPAYEHLYHTLTTAKGEIYTLTLSDGSKVWLNSASSIRFPVAFGPSAREVTVTGEAYFEVAKDARRKFLVDAGGVVTEVLGTKFNVNAYADEAVTAVTLLEGSVRIFNEEHSVNLRPGEQASVPGEMAERRSAEPKVLNSIDAASVVAWKDGYFHFNEADLFTVMRQLMRWYNVEVVYTSAIPKRRFGGKMEKDLLLSQVLKILEKSGVNFTVEGNKLLVSP